MKRLMILLMALFLILRPDIVLCAQYTITRLGTLGGSTSKAFGINNQGQIVGYSVTGASGIVHAFLWDKQNGMRDLGTLGGVRSEAYAINDIGQIVGYAERSDAKGDAFLYDDHMIGLGGYYSTAYGISNNGKVVGKYIGENDYCAFLWDQENGMQDIGALWYHGAVAYGVNDAGEVAGESHIKPVDLYPGDTHAFLFDGAMHDLGTLGGRGSSASSINNSGQIVGKSSNNTASIASAFLWDEINGMVDIGPAGAVFSQALDINEQGQIVGFSMGWKMPPPFQSAFIYDDHDGLQDLNDLLIDGSGWYLRFAQSINDQGQIAGWGTYGSNFEAYLLDPIPIPGAVWLFGSGLVVLAGFRWKFRRVRHSVVEQ